MTERLGVISRMSAMHRMSCYMGFDPGSVSESGDHQFHLSYPEWVEFHGEYPDIGAHQTQSEHHIT